MADDLKLKTLFLYMWRHLQASLREQMQTENHQGSLSSYKGGLVRGAQLLNERFLAMWSKDNYRDYLQVRVHMYVPLPLSLALSLSQTH